MRGFSAYAGPESFVRRRLTQKNVRLQTCSTAGTYANSRTSADVCIRRSSEQSRCPRVAAGGRLVLPACLAAPAQASFRALNNMVRLQKFLADAGVASRRASEAIITEGRVSVNGQVASALGTKVDPGRDRVDVDGRPVKARRKIYIALNKPRGVVSTRKDTEGRQTLHDLLPREWQHLYSVGRLDRDSEGLIFLTNDGDFSLHLTHPRYGVTKKYHVVVEGKVQPPVVAQMTCGVREKGELLK